MHRLVAVLVTTCALLAGCTTPYQSSETTQCPAVREAPDASGNGSRVTVWARNDAMRNAVFCVSVNDVGPVRADVPARGRTPALMEAFNTTLSNATLVVDATEARADLEASERFTRADANHVVVTLTEDERLTIEYRSTPPERP